MVSMRLFVSEGKKLHNVMVDSNDTILNAKEQLRTIAGIPVEQQCFLWRGKQLDDDRPFSYYGIRGGGFFDLERLK